ncbi:MAG: trypsin-like peptidase domain-containing protein [Kouleothrix sp.]|nr:trypsin-like peptidase domain-containing protein [Kouleothrix sp.]
MSIHRVRLLAAAMLLALALAGCSRNDTSGLSDQPSAAPERSTSAAARGAPGAEPTAKPAGDVAPVSLQQSTPIPQSAQQGLDAEEQIVANVYDRAAPAVVRITTGQGLGSGYLIDKDGHIITNNHVIADSQNGQVRVAFTGLFETVGQVVGADADADVAVVKVDQLPQDVAPVELGDSSQIRVGQRTIAIGNPLGQDRTVTTGIVSALGRTITEGDGQQGPAFSIGGAIQTDAAINPGNSGGPLLDSGGRVIGMNTVILSQSGTSSGIGFAVPVNLIKKVATALIEQGHYDHPYLGVGLKTVTTLDAQQNNLPSAGVLIESNQDGPVAQAGLKGQAVLTAINGTPMTSEEDVITFLELNSKPGDTVTLTLVGSDGKQHDLQVQLGSRPRAENGQ